MRKTAERIFATLAVLLASLLFVAQPAWAQDVSGTVKASSLSYGSDIDLTGDTTIVLSKGDNVTVNHIDCHYHTLTFRGSSEGTITCRYGIDASSYGDSLTIKGGAINVTGEFGPGNDSYGVRCLGNFTMTGGSLYINNPGKNYRWSSYGLYVSGDFTMSGGNLASYCTASSKYCKALGVSGNGTITGGAIEVYAKNTAAGNYATGIGTASGSDVAWNITGGVINAEATTPPDTSIPGYTNYEGYAIHLSNSEDQTNYISGNAQITAKGSYLGLRSHGSLVINGDAQVSCEGIDSGLVGNCGIWIADRAYVEARASEDHPISGGSGGIDFDSDHGITSPSGGYVGTYSGVGYTTGSCVFGSGGSIPTYVCIRRTTNIPMHRLYNQWTGEHFYTASNQERDNLTSVGWTYEGVGWTAPPTGRTVYRLYNPWVPGGDHHYTMDLDEYYACIAAGWTGEGFGWYSYRAPGGHYQGVPVYRQYNPWAVTGSHNYTTSTSERDHLISVGWKDEGIAWRGV